ncbi:putative Mg2+ transporter-C (MgtC) family protein [Melghirimyces profundicolus]|uniref:Putative Mg2+ transporter-C (MgtC) family protein n=1 Tax=Melghirimyces profundicolus TaxID=1242148 RepID=A0A2T6BQ00_9BACL|nr:MgtC/SapB family protein [Melghirimyces profundicolus]PTX58139.1 putative Mg2+ transporter-C (MgtC) family protein [Melghirimyces profundicolus]
MEADSVWVISQGETVVRLLAATALGGLIGWERERNNHPAGFRTHILVCVGSALIMLLSIYGFPQFMDEDKVRFDPGRIAAQVVSGIGFLGAGTILRQGLTVSGLTTAASLWVVAAIGLAVGAGFHFPAVLTTVLALVSLELLNKVEDWLFRSSPQKLLRIRALNRPGKLGELATLIGDLGIHIRKVKVDEGEPSDQEMEIMLAVRIPTEIDSTEMIDRVRKVEGVREVHLD